MALTWKLSAALGCVLAVLAGGAGSRIVQPVRAADAVITVTSTLDDTGDDVPECPSDTLCTLRQAIETANADGSDDLLQIVFDPAIFPLVEPATIEITGQALPALSRSNAAIDGSGAGVILTGPTLAGPEANGVAITGAASGVTGLQIIDFAAACIFLEGVDTFAGVHAEGSRNHLDDCAIGILATGAGAKIRGNVIGMKPADPATPAMQTGVVAAAADVVIGGVVPPIPAYNAIGNVPSAIVVGRGAGDAFSGVVVRHNLIGESYERMAAPVDTAVLIDHPSNATLVADNAIHNAGTGIAIVADVNGMTTAGNTLTGNTYEGLRGLAIDLGFDGLRNPNDDGDADNGPNTFLNFPVLTTSSQSLLAGTACANCRVTLYGASHVPGTDSDFPLSPIIGGGVFADDTGQFSIASPLVSPGDWLMGIATDAAGNTSEFSPSVYVGAGTVQCGNIALQPGWNLVGYFGSTTSLESSALPQAITAAHSLVGGSYASWFPGGPSTLSFLQTGEPYWFYSDTIAALDGGISLSTALPVQLSEGWNDFVYIGAAVDVADALAPLGDSWSALYRFDNDGNAPGRWQSYGGPDTPGFAHAFKAMQPCTAFRILMLSDQTFVPLAP